MPVAHERKQAAAIMFKVVNHRAALQGFQDFAWCLGWESVALLSHEGTFPSS